MDEESTTPVLVLGIGNLLMGDEGVGVHAARLLQHTPLPPHAHVLDGGTGGFTLLEHLQGYRQAIIVDATIDGRAPGSVSLLQPRYASDYPRTLGAHDIGLKDLIEAAELLGQMPRVALVTISIADMSCMSLDLSPPVQAALPRVTETVLHLLAALPAWDTAAGY